MPEETDQSRNEDEHNSANRPYTDKFNNRIRETKAAPRMPDPGESGSAAPVTRRPRIELSLTQILGSTGAAVTAAFLGSRLGVAGTLIGAALASVISVVGGAIYTNSIKATRRRVSQVIVAVRSQDDAVHGENEGAKHEAKSLPHLVSALPLLLVDAAAPDVPPPTAAPGTIAAPGTAAARFRRPTLRTAALGGLLAATVFAGALVVVTGYETVSGTAISGGQSGGLSILGGGRVSPGTPTRIPTTGATTTPATSSVTTSRATTSGRTKPSTTTTSSTASTARTTTRPSTPGGTSGTTAVVPPPTGSGTGTSTAASTPASGSALGPSQNLVTGVSTTP